MLNVLIRRVQVHLDLTCEWSKLSKYSSKTTPDNYVIEFQYCYQITDVVLSVLNFNLTGHTVVQLLLFPYWLQREKTFEKLKNIFSCTDSSQFCSPACPQVYNYYI